MENGKVTDATRIERSRADHHRDRRQGRQGDPARAFRPAEGTAIPKESLKPVAAAVAQRQAGRSPSPTTASATKAEAAVAAMKPGDILLSGEHPLPQRRGEERSGVRRRARQARRPLGQRRLLGRAPRARLDRRARPQAARLCRPHHAGRARSAGEGAGSAEEAGDRHRRRRQGLDQARPAGKSRRQGRRAGDRRRHGQHLPACARASSVGKSLAEKDLADTARRILDKAEAQNCAIILPVDADRRLPFRGQRAVARLWRRRHPGRRHDPRYRPAIDRARQGRDRRGRDAGLERPARRLRAAAVRQRQPWRPPNMRRNAPKPESWSRSRAAATPWRR